jgi:hypothetical protein
MAISGHHADENGRCHAPATIFGAQSAAADQPISATLAPGGRHLAPDIAREASNVTASPPDDAPSYSPRHREEQQREAHQRRHRAPCRRAHIQPRHAARAHAHHAVHIEGRTAHQRGKNDICGDLQHIHGPTPISSNRGRSRSPRRSRARRHPRPPPTITAATRSSRYNAQPASTITCAQGSALGTGQAARSTELPCRNQASPIRPRRQSARPAAVARDRTLALTRRRRRAYSTCAKLGPLPVAEGAFPAAHDAPPPPASAPSSRLAAVEPYRIARPSTTSAEAHRVETYR